LNKLTAKLQQILHWVQANSVGCLNHLNPAGYHVYTFGLLDPPLDGFEGLQMNNCPLKWILVALAFILPLSAFPAAEVHYPPANYGTGAVAEQVKRGEYLAKAGDCIACHTVEGGKAYAGGLPVKTPFGTIYSPNITPDKETGIGSWSEEDFDKAMREGISKHGEYLLPVFPYVFYNKLSHQDVADIKAYLDKIPAVHQENRALDMPFPFNLRILQSFWRFMFFDFQKGEFVPDTRKSDEWNRGAYLVEGLGHCAMCHTPINALGSWKREYDLTGGTVDIYHAPNISASRLKDVPVEKIVDVFTHDKTIQGGHVQGPMLEVNHDSLRYLTKEDLTAIATYIKTVESKMPPAPEHGSGEKAGKAVYTQYCASCHAMGGGGAPKLGDASQWEPLVKLGMTQLYDNAEKGIGGMPPKGNCDSCNAEQIKAAVDYMVNNSRGKSGESSSAINPAQSWTSLERGKKVYDQVCTVCHKEGQLGAPKLGDKQAWDPIVKENLDILIQHAIEGYKSHPAKGACYLCSDADIISAVKYMAQQSGSGDYTLW
jgi:cytochrome c5